MPAMHDDVWALMNSSLVVKLERMVQTIPPLDMTHEECMELLAPAEHIDILTKATMFANVQNDEVWMEVAVPGDIDGSSFQKVCIAMRTHAEERPPLAPAWPMWQPGKSGHKIIAWLHRRYEIGRRFATARYVLHYLNSECDSGRQLRYMWPAVMHLCTQGVDPRMDKWIEKYSAYRPCQYVPAVTPAIKEAILDASALLTSVALIGEDIPHQPAGYVQIMPCGASSFKIGDASIDRM